MNLLWAILAAIDHSICLLQRTEELPMRRLVSSILAGLLLAGPATAVANAAPAMEIPPPQANPPLQLSEAQPQQVLQAVTAKNTDDKLPADFKPANGAKVPSQKK